MMLIMHKIFRISATTATALLLLTVLATTTAVQVWGHAMAPWFYKPQDKYTNLGAQWYQSPYADYIWRSDERHVWMGSWAAADTTLDYRLLSYQEADGSGSVVYSQGVSGWIHRTAGGSVNSPGFTWGHTLSMFKSWDSWVYARTEHHDRACPPGQGCTDTYWARDTSIWFPPEGAR